MGAVAWDSLWAIRDSLTAILVTVALIWWLDPGFEINGAARAALISGVMAFALSIGWRSAMRGIVFIPVDLDRRQSDWTPC